MRVVELAGSLPASAEPRRIEKNGIASTTMINVATPAIAAGRFWITSAHRAQRGDSSVTRCLPSRSARRSRRRGTHLPSSPSSAGSSVSAASTVNATAIAAAIATPYRKLIPRANMPSIAMQTITPANSTARPEVSSDSTVACSRDAPLSTACR